MPIFRPLLLFTTILLYLPGFLLTALSQDTVTTAETEPILRFLSDDRLKGRPSFSRENQEAAEFIAGEFRKSGLVPMQGSEDLIQEFHVRRLRPRSKSAVLDGSVIDTSRILVSSTLESFEWTEKDSLPVAVMGGEFDRSLLRSVTKGIVLVPTRHAAVLDRFRRFFGGERISEEGGPERALVLILTDGPEPATFRISYSADADEPALHNVVGVLPGRKPGESILFSAHYDHIGILPPVDGDSIANGANDDASGTTGVIALARYFAARGTPVRTLIFAAFAGEEIGGLGSRYLSRRMDPDTILAMVNLEMIGTPSKFGPGSFWITGYEQSTLGAIVSEQLRGTGYEAHPDPYPAQNLFFRSDNAVFARLGVPAHSFSTARMDVDTNYHTVGDGFDSIDIGALTTTINGVAAGVRALVDGEGRPSRIELPE